MTKNLIRKTLKYSYLDGIFASVMVGFSEQFFIPYCLALGGTLGFVAVLAAMPNFIGSLSQLFTSEAIEKFRSRKKVIIVFVFLHALMWIPILLIPYVFEKNLVLLIVFVILYSSCNLFCMPAWASLMSEYIPSKMRGRYFGWRNKKLGTIIVISGLIAGLILYFFDTNRITGFSVIFGTAFISRLISWCFLTKMYEPFYRHAPEARFTFFDFLKRAKESNFAKFVFIVGGMSFSVNIASPFFAVYMIRDLGFNYVIYSAVTVSAFLPSFVMMERWGRHGDIVGNIKIMRACAVFTPLIPIFWLVSHNIIYLVLIQIFSGFIWAGFNISVSNFIYDAVTPVKRSRCISYFNVINGTSIFLGALLGSYLAMRVPGIFGYKLLAIFLISGLLRIIPALGSFSIKEVRNVQKAKNRELFYSMIGIKPLLPSEEIIA